MTTETTLSIEDKVFALSTMTNRDHAGRHFAQRYSDDLLSALESEGLIEIDRPIHPGTGLSYSEEYHHLTVTDAGRDLVESNEEYWDRSNVS